MDIANGHTLNLANSIIGVGILAMPYCFRQCGIILSIFLLLISSIISRLACHFLLKSAIIARRKTFEFLAFHTFGSLGKFAIEIGMIGFLVGTCIAFFVVMGDLGPAFLSEMTGAQIGSALRNGTLVGLAVFCVLPLGLLRNVDSLHGVSTATIGFYCCLVVKIVIEALPHIFNGDWMSEVVLWRPGGILQCLPIFSMALFCQTQLFEIYQAIPNASLDKMNGMIRVAVNMCTWVYIFVGAFGYIAFFQKPFGGNILLSFTPSIASNVIKIGFVLSLAFSFPLVIFPCRASLHSLLYKGTPYTGIHEGTSSNYIPEGKFKLLTIIIVTVSLIIGIMIPSIELVLGLIGSTIGVMICVLFPVTCFICISPKNTNERILAQMMLFVGIIVMVLGSYANLQAIEKANFSVMTEKSPQLVDIPPAIKNEPEKSVVVDILTTIKVPPKETKLKSLDMVPNILEDVKKVAEISKEVRHEPPQPEEPIENPEIPKSEKPEILETKKVEEKPILDIKVEKIVSSDEKKPVKKTEEVDIEAIKKEESELKEQEKVEKDKNQDLIDTMQKQQEVQRELVEQQKKLIEVLQKQQENVNINQQDAEKVKEEKVKAVKEIEDIAKRAIESISGKEAKIAEGAKKDTKVEVINKTRTVEEVGKETRTDHNVKNASSEVIKSKINLTKEETKVKTNGTKSILKSHINMNNDVKNLTQQLPMAPLPIVRAKLNNASLETNLKNVTMKNKTENSDINSMRRDILSAVDNSEIRRKRQVSENEFETVNKESVNEVTTSTEKSLIKMLCKLSEPNIPHKKVDLSALEHEILDVKPQKRDLKQVINN